VTLRGFGAYCTARRAHHDFEPMNAVDPGLLLANLTLFRELSDEQRGPLAASARLERFARGDVLFRRGDECHGMHVVVYGRVKLSFVSSSGVEKVVDIIEPGGSFGEAVMFLEVPHVVSAQALADALLLFLPKVVVFAQTESDPRFARRMLGGLSRRLHQLMADVESYSLRSGTERLIGFLLGDGGGERSDGGNVLDVQLPVAKAVIASRLNLTQEHFSRILHDLAALGLIEVQGRRIRVLDVARLRSHAK
jgi:CRP-like cAMP-binding protein